MGKNDIPFGRENAITRQELRVKWGLSDRSVRRIIAGMRMIDDGSDTVIVSVSNGRGYYRTNNIGEIEHFVREMQKRARRTFGAISTARHILARLKRAEAHGGRQIGA